MPNAEQWIGKNNLYGYAISKSLPTDEFKSLDPAKFNLNNYDYDSEIDCILEVELEYCKELHELHNGYPLPPDKLEIEREMCLIII